MMKYLGNYTNLNNRLVDTYCRGSQGGGLYASEIINGKEKDVVIGILSYHLLCGLQLVFSIYTILLLYTSSFINTLFIINLEYSLVFSIMRIGLPKRVIIRHKFRLAN